MVSIRKQKLTRKRFLVLLRYLGVLAVCVGDGRVRRRSLVGQTGLMAVLPAFPVARQAQDFRPLPADATFPRIAFSVKLAALQQILAAVRASAVARPGHHEQNHAKIHWRNTRRGGLSPP